MKKLFLIIISLSLFSDGLKAQFMPIGHQTEIRFEQDDSLLTIPNHIIGQPYKCDSTSVWEIGGYITVNQNQSLSTIQLQCTYTNSYGHLLTKSWPALQWNDSQYTPIQIIIKAGTMVTWQTKLASGTGLGMQFRCGATMRKIR